MANTECTRYRGLKAVVKQSTLYGENETNKQLMERAQSSHWSKQSGGRALVLRRAGRELMRVLFLQNATTR